GPTSSAAPSPPAPTPTSPPTSPTTASSSPSTPTAARAWRSWTPATTRRSHSRKACSWSGSTTTSPGSRSTAPATAPHPCARSCRGGRDARPFAANSPGGGAFVVGAVFIAATPPHRTHSYRMATETTKSIEDQLRALIRLQYIDSRIDQIHKMQGDLPEEIHDLEDEKAGLETRIEKAQRDAQEGEVQRKKLKL